MGISYKNKKIMQNKVRKSFLYGLIFVTALFPSQPVFAASNQLLVSYTPSNSQMPKGTTFCIDIKSYADNPSNPGTAAGTVTYTSSRLSVVSGSIKTGSNSCSGSASNNYGSHSVTKSSGKLSFNASKANMDSGIAQVFTVKFKAIAAGTAQITFSGGKVNGQSTTLNHGSYIITDNSPRPSSSPSPVPTVSSKPAPATSDEEEKVEEVEDPSGYVTDVTVDSSYKTATLTWKVNLKSSKATIKYGQDSSDLSSTTKATKKNGVFTADIKDLIPGSRYYFTITGSGDGKEGEYSSAIYTLGYPVVLNITENGIAAKGATVQIGNINNLTDTNGKLALALAAGDYSGTITTTTSTLSINFTVQSSDIPPGDAPPETQTYPFDLESSILDQGPGSGGSLLTFIGIMAVGAVMLGVGFVIFVTIRRKRFEMDSAPVSRIQSVVVDDGFNWKDQTPAEKPSQTQSGPTPPPHRNDLPLPPSSSNSSVHLDEEEPADMFDFDKRPPADEPLEIKEKENEGPRINISH